MTFLGQEFFASKISELGARLPSILKCPIWICRIVQLATLDSSVSWDTWFEFSIQRRKTVLTASVNFPRTSVLNTLLSCWTSKLAGSFTRQIQKWRNTYFFMASGCSTQAGHNDAATKKTSSPGVPLTVSWPIFEKVYAGKDSFIFLLFLSESKKQWTCIHKMERIHLPPWIVFIYHRYLLKASSKLSGYYEMM